MQIYAFVYDIIMKFPVCTFIFETVTAQGFFGNIYWLINFKVHIDHSHVIGEIYGYSHDFCDLKIKVYQVGFSCIAYNYFNFDFYFMLRVSCWDEDINIGETYLSNVNFSNIGKQIKIIDIMKYFQTSLAQITSTVITEEKEKIKKLTFQFLVRHDYFGNV